jgi:transcriptional regulator
MHPNPIYRQASQDENLAFAAARGFGVLAVNGDDGPLISHIPYRIEDRAVELHLMRSNPIARALVAPQPAVLAVTGAHSYVSPDWYGIEDQVPTWMYVAVHLRGKLELLGDAALGPVLERLSARFEAQLLPKPPWSTAKMPPDVMARLMRMIVPCRLTVETVDGTWKLGQNKAEAARLAAADAVERAGIGDGLAELAALMRGAG